MFQDVQRQHRIKRSVLEGKLLRIARQGHDLLPHFEKVGRPVDRYHLKSSGRQRGRNTAGAGADIED
jgi:hypothetical protein